MEIRTTQSDEVSDDSDASDDSLSSNQSATKPWDNKHIYSGYLKHGNAFKPVAILRDTGSAVHAVHEQFITKEQLLPNTQKIITFGGKSESFSLAEIQVDTPFISGTITACVLRDYPDNFKNYDILIGNGDVLGSPVARDPHPDLISSWTSDHENVLQSNQVDTRSSSKKSQEARITSLASYFNISHLLHFIFLIFCIFCIDFRSVSSQTVSMSVPILDQDLLFAKFDLCEEFWQIRTSPESRPITAFQAGGESYQFSCIQFLGHLVGGVRLTPSDNTKKIIKLKVPTTQKKEKSLLGLIDFYGKISTIMTPIYSKLVGKADPKNIDWTVDCDNTLLAVKKAISAPPVLQSSNITAQFFIQVDASGTGLGAAMLQEVNNMLHPCLYVSRKLREEVRGHRARVPSNLLGSAPPFKIPARKPLHSSNRPPALEVPSSRKADESPSL